MGVRKGVGREVSDTSWGYRAPFWIYIFSRELMRAFLPNFGIQTDLGEFYRKIVWGLTESWKTLFWPNKLKNLSRKKNCPPFCMKIFYCGFWKTSFMGFRFVVNTSATHHNPIICTSKKQNARPRPVKQLHFNRKIFGGKFRARILNQLQSKRK